VNWVLVFAAAAGWIVVVLLLAVLPGRSRRQIRRSCLRLRSHVEPYLLRRGTEAGLQPPLEPTDPSRESEQIVDALCEMADRLTAHERTQVELGDTVNLAVSDTMPLERIDEQEVAKEE
jgi:hypothetical protein